MVSSLIIQPQLMIYGSVDSAYLPPTIDHGDLVTLPGEENPFGLFRITGGDIGHKQTFTLIL